MFRLAWKTNQHPARCIPVALFQVLKVVGVYCYSFSFNDCSCIMPDVVLKGAQYMFTSNVIDHRVNRHLDDACVIIRGFNSDVESESNFEGYDAE